MKMFGTFALAALALAAPAAARAAEADCTGEPSNTRLYVNVTGVREAKGLIAVTLYADDSKKFLAKHGSLYVGRVPAHAGTTRVCIFVPTTGIYALAVYHDADANRKINRTGIGLPAEAYGFSNNPRTFFSLPSFRSVRLSVPRSGLETTVTLKYP